MSFPLVQGYERPRAYIATQRPKPETIFDFWRMLWENKAVRIVMLTNLVEGDKKKCDLYWPEDKPLQLLGLTVLKESERVSNDYTIRTFSMTRDGERRTVRNFSLLSSIHPTRSFATTMLSWA